jgi:hypothetical protein
MDWIEGENARGADSVLAKMVLGTNEGLTGSTELEVEEAWVGVFDLVLLWLALGDASVQNSLMDENATPLLEIALYFGLDALVEAIREEERKREEIEKARLLLEQDRLKKARLARLEQERRIKQRARGIVRCYACGNQTTVAPTYRGTTPRCWSCRKSRDYDDNDEDYFYHDSYDSDGWSYNS